MNHLTNIILGINTILLAVVLTQIIELKAAIPQFGGLLEHTRATLDDVSKNAQRADELSSKIRESFARVKETLDAEDSRAHRFQQLPGAITESPPPANSAPLNAPTAGPLPIPPNILAALSSSLTISERRVDDGMEFYRGEATDQRAVDILISGLESSGLYERVELTNTQATPQGLIEFRLNAIPKK